MTVWLHTWDNLLQYHEKSWDIIKPISNIRSLTSYKRHARSSIINVRFILNTIFYTLQVYDCFRNGPTEFDFSYCTIKFCNHINLCTQAVWPSDHLSNWWLEKWHSFIGWRSHACISWSFVFSTIDVIITSIHVVWS